MVIANFDFVAFTGETAFRLVQENGHKKGDVLAVAEVAGIMAVKSTASLIPLCHPLAVSSIDISITQNSAGKGIVSPACSFII